MRRKIIYVNFIKRRRITFTHFIINKIIYLLMIKFKVKNRTPTDVETDNNRRISN